MLRVGEVLCHKHTATPQQTVCETRLAPPPFTISISLLSLTPLPPHSSSSCPAYDARDYTVGSGSDAASLATTATPVEGGWLLSGAKAFISGAGASDVYLVMARCQGQMPSSIEAATAAAADVGAAAHDSGGGGAGSSSGGSGGGGGLLPPGVPLPPVGEGVQEGVKSPPVDSAGRWVLVRAAWCGVEGC